MAIATGVPLSADDGYVYSTTFNNSANELLYGNVGASAGSFICFKSISIPKGSTITDVKIWRKVRYTLSSAGANVNYYFNNVDDAVAPTSAAEFNALALTSAVSVNGLAAETAGATGYLYEDGVGKPLSAIIQGVIDRAGWVEDNAMMLIIKDNGSTSGSYRASYSKNGDSSNPLTIEITYTPPESTPIIGVKYSMPPFKRV